LEWRKREGREVGRKGWGKGRAYPDVLIDFDHSESNVTCNEKKKVSLLYHVKLGEGKKK